MRLDALIGEDARTFVDRDHATITPEELPIWERPKALKVLAKECDSFTRLGAGLAAWVAGVAGGASLAALFWSGAPVWVRILGLVLAIPLLGGAAILGRQVWHAGRKVVDAFCWWTTLPELLPEGGAGAEQWRDAPFRDAVEARVFMFEGWRPLRMVLAVLSLFAPLAFIQTALTDSPRFQPTWQDGQGTSVTIFVLTLAVVGVFAGAVTFGGQFRANRAHSERDPIQRRILGRDR